MNASAIATNSTIIGMMLMLLVVYCSVVVLPPWDDGTGLALPIDSTPSDEAQLQQIKDVEIPRAVQRWVANLTFRSERKSSSSSSFALFDSRLELGHALVMRVRFCDDGCPCDSDLREKIPCTTTTKADAVESSMRGLAVENAISMETEALDRLVVKLRHYYQTNAGVDVFFTALFAEGLVDAEKAAVETRHTSWLRGQPRLPPRRRDQQNLVFVPAERDARWVHDLSMDPQSNVLKHAPFLFPVLLTILVCLVRIVVAIVK